MSTYGVLQWELELIWTAEALELIVFSPHARRAADDDAIPAKAISRVIRDGIPRSKDIERLSDRKVGINFEGKRRRGGWIRTKVSWLGEYIIATVHEL